MKDQSIMYDVWKYFDTYPDCKIASNLPIEKAKELAKTKQQTAGHLISYEVRSASVQ